MTKLDREALRIAAAFQIGELEKYDFTRNHKRYQGFLSCGEVVAWDRKGGVSLHRVWIGQWCVMSRLSDGHWHVDVDTPDERNWGDFMARGLYCLGFSEKGVLAELPPLSAHQQVEARLSMPREYWPQKWREEAYTSSNGKP